MFFELIAEWSSLSARNQDPAECRVASAEQIAKVEADRNNPAYAESRASNRAYEDELFPNSSCRKGLGDLRLKMLAYCSAPSRPPEDFTATPSGPRSGKKATARGGSGSRTATPAWSSSRRSPVPSPRRPIRSDGVRSAAVSATSRRRPSRQVSPIRAVKGPAPSGRAKSLMCLLPHPRECR
jgi:hypothetical protein